MFELQDFILGSLTESDESLRWKYVVVKYDDVLYHDFVMDADDNGRKARWQFSYLALLVNIPRKTGAAIFKPHMYHLFHIYYRYNFIAACDKS